MKAALAILFFTCIAGSMASDLSTLLNLATQQGQGIIQSVLANLQQTLMGLLSNGVGQLTTLIGSIGGRFDIDFNQIFSQLTSSLPTLVNSLLAQLVGSLPSLLSGIRALDIGAIFGDFWNQISGSVAGIGQHLLNQGLSAVLGSLSGGSRAFGDFWSSLTEQLSGAVSVAQGAIQGALGNLAAIGSGIIDASKPHFQQLQEQLVGHGLNALGSLSETINNLHGSIVGRR
ncbi:unnamed protein product [Rotaria socialis]